MESTYLKLLKLKHIFLGPPHKTTAKSMVSPLQIAEPAPQNHSVFDNYFF